MKTIKGREKKTKAGRKKNHERRLFLTSGKQQKKTERAAVVRISKILLPPLLWAKIQIVEIIYAVVV